MFVRVIRVLIGFALASLAAAVTLVLFVYAPAEWASLPADLSGERLSEAGFFALVVTPHIAVYAALPVLAGVIFAEARKIAGCTFYALAGIGTAAAGFLVFHLSEAPDQATILQNYALIAFLTAGLVGGLAYWVFSGRFAAPRGGPAAAPDQQASPG
jgi:hypothetical protein